MLLRSIAILTAFVASLAWAQAPRQSAKPEPVRSVDGEQRYALAIGINDYREVTRLEKAVNDARAVGKALEQAGFRVEVLINPGKADMSRAINRFVQNLGGGGQGVFFFAGHGVQINNQNYLLPMDVQAPQVEADVEDQAISLQVIQDRLAQVRAKFALLVLDACRDNPLPRKAGRSLGGTRGLAQPSGAEGQMVVFSAGANQQALDRLSDRDGDPNGVFTREFLPWIGRPGVSVREAVLQVRRAVRARALAVNHQQFPAVYDQVDGDFFFIPQSGAVVAAIPTAPMPVPVPPPAPAPLPAPEPAVVDPAESAYWAEVKRLDDPAAYAAYVNAYPSGRYLADAREFIDRARRNQEARARLAEDQAWARAEQTGSAASYAAYLISYPSGRFAALAMLKRERMGSRDCLECPEMVSIPAGSFSMGSPQNEVHRNGDEGPQRTVVIAQPFAMGRTEVTFEQWDACVADGGCMHRPSDEGWGRGSRPVINVNWNDAQEYLAWLSRKTGQRYRLPSEAEWEYACRAGSRTRYCGSEDLDAVAWTIRNSQGRSQPVGGLQANAWGLHDMSGNVWEWVEDCYTPSYAGAPADASARTGGTCAARLLRGGSWDGSPGIARSAFRSRGIPDNREGGFGFRVVRALR